VLTQLTRTLVGFSRNAPSGQFFPEASRTPPASAPNGSTVQRTSFGFSIAHHSLTLPHLDEALTVLQFSDVHLRRPSASLDRICEGLSTLEPDLVVLTGDLVAKEWTETALHQFLSHLPTARLGRWAIMGNWEYWAGLSVERYRTLLEVHKIQLLCNTSEQVGPITLVGLDDALAGAPDNRLAFSGVDPKSAVVCLAHCPISFDQLEDYPAHLVLSGHTHGGQLQLPGLGALWVPKGSGPYIHGFYSRHNRWLSVTRGLGWSIAPARLRCDPEVALYHLCPEDQAPPEHP